MTDRIPTPAAPWRYAGQGVIVGADNRAIAYIAVGRQAEADAIAALIVHAPQMLAHIEDVERDDPVGEDESLRDERQGGHPHPHPLGGAGVSPHDWVPSTHGHGETMCSRCRITNREAAVLGETNGPCPVTAAAAPDGCQTPEQCAMLDREDRMACGCHMGSGSPVPS